MNDQIRTFIAVELPEPLKLCLKQVQNQLSSACSSKTRWVEPQNIHLTLKFLGNVDISKIKEIEVSLREAASGIRPFSLNLAQLGAFPNLRNVQIVWLGLGGEIEILKDLQRRVESCLIPLGFPCENRPFTGHLTLARLKDYASQQERQELGDLIARTKIELNLPVEVKSVSLIKSTLTPRGPLYDRMCEIDLKTY
jgi:2'-5' RNA ligase